MLNLLGLLFFISLEFGFDPDCNLAGLFGFVVVGCVIVYSTFLMSSFNLCYYLLGFFGRLFVFVGVDLNDFEKSKETCFLS